MLNEVYDELSQFKRKISKITTIKSLRRILEQENIDMLLYFLNGNLNRFMWNVTKNFQAGLWAINFSITLQKNGFIKYSEELSLIAENLETVRSLEKKILNTIKKSLLK